MESWSIDFKENSCYRLQESLRMITLAFDKVNDSKIWTRPNTTGNSLGNQILHLCGNMTQYVISSLGEQEDKRNRPIEFSTTSGYTKTALLKKLDDTITQTCTLITEATEKQLLQKRDVQGFHFSGMGCVIHAVEHCSYHTGQIAFWIKQLTDSDLGFYDGLDLTVKNK